MHSQWQGLNTIAFPSCLASNLSSSKKYSHCTEICLTVKIFLSQTVVIKSFKITQSPPKRKKKYLHRYLTTGTIYSWTIKIWQASYITVSTC